jgi:hypothetical protein
MPIPPSAHVVRVSVPLSSCADAARVLIDVFGGEQEATRVLGGVRWWQVRAGDQGCVLSLISCLLRSHRMNRDRSIDAEWIMEKKDWRQSVRQERAAAATPAGGANTRLRSGGSSSDGPTSSSSPTSDHGVRANGTDDANAYQPEMDEMRCLLWAHGGSFHVGFLPPFYVNL